MVLNIILKKINNNIDNENNKLKKEKIVSIGIVNDIVKKIVNVENKKQQKKQWR